MTPDEGEISKRDLINELKEATELIEMVKGIQGGVAANPVLNGGDKKTEVKVESNVLDGDIVDRALESAQRKADSFKKLIVTIAPLFLLVGGGGSMEMLGVINIFEDPSDENNIIFGCTDSTAWNYDEYAEEDDGSCEYDDDIIWGCMDPSADNYDASANEDDGSCEYDEEECDPHFYSNYAYWPEDEIEFEFDVDFDCGRTDEVEVLIEIFKCNESAQEASTNLWFYTNGTEADYRSLFYEEADPAQCYDAKWELFYDGRHVDHVETNDIRK